MRQCSFAQLWEQALLQIEPAWGPLTERVRQRRTPEPVEDLFWRCEEVLARTQPSPAGLLNEVQSAIQSLPDAAALEITLAGPTLRAEHELACVVSGAPCSLGSDRQKLAMGKTFTLHPQELLHLGGVRDGAYA